MFDAGGIWFPLHWPNHLRLGGKRDEIEERGHEIEDSI
jgi:hypothetical protein